MDQLCIHVHVPVTADCRNHPILLSDSCFKENPEQYFLLLTTFVTNLEQILLLLEPYSEKAIKYVWKRTNEHVLSGRCLGNLCQAYGVRLSGLAFCFWKK